MSSNSKQVTAEQLLGLLNKVEQKYAPKLIFAAGHTEFLESGFRVSIVGSRKASHDGLQRARKLARLVSQREGVVVSGLAAGIDTAAHRSAIDAGGRTVAVIGTPLSEVYPKENAQLQQIIMQDHLCISQFPQGHPVQRANFPMRNRTMALISDATVIIEAGESSGSISQGWEALRLGRGLFITETLAENHALTWPQKMLSCGAKVLSNETISQFFDSLPERQGTQHFDAVAF